MQNDNIENKEKYVIQNTAQIVQKLRVLAKAKSLVTAHFNSGQESLLTVVLDVLKDKKLVVLDYGSEERINQKILQAERVVFKTQHQGITAQFSSKNVLKAKIKGEPVFAVPIPDDLLWLQRREFFRLPTPLRNPVECYFTDANGEERAHTVLDIGIGGLAIADPDNHFDLNVEELTEPLSYECRVVLPNFGEGRVTLELRNHAPLKRTEPDAGQRIGCSFVDVEKGFEANIQRYMNSVEAQRRQLQND